MRRQRGLVLEVFPTLPALVGLLPCVDSAVLDQGGLPHEGLSPHATLEGPLVTGWPDAGAGRTPSGSFSRIRRSGKGFSPVWMCR